MRCKHGMKPEYCSICRGENAKPQKVWGGHWYLKGEDIHDRPFKRHLVRKLTGHPRLHPKDPG